MAISLQEATFAELLDPFQGREDLEKKIIRTPLRPDDTFSDDPLRMMRAVRFAAQLDFRITKIHFGASESRLIVYQLYPLSALPSNFKRLLDQLSHPSDFNCYLRLSFWGNFSLKWRRSTG